MPIDHETNNSIIYNGWREPMRSLRLNDTGKYFCPCYLPANLTGNHEKAKQIIRQLKQVGPETIPILQQYVKKGLDDLFTFYHPKNEFDAVIPIPSAAQLSPFIYNMIQSEYFEFGCLYGGSLLKKNKNKDLRIDVPVLMKEYNAGKLTDKTLQKVLGYHHSLNSPGCRNNPFEVKDFGAKTRRFFTNLFYVDGNPQRQVNKILITDDTIGESKTFAEAIVALQTVWPNAEYVCFAFIRDFPSLTRQTFGLY